MGVYGEIITSLNGVTWTKRNLGTTEGLAGVTYGNGIFVIISSIGHIFTSLDGITWTKNNSGPINGQSVAYGNNLFMAIGGDTILTSPDGITWTKK